MSILERMSFDGDRIFEIEKLPDGRFVITEQCDQYFGCYLTADELRQLGEEIIALANGE